MTQHFGRPTATGMYANVGDGRFSVSINTNGPLSNTESWVAGFDIEGTGEDDTFIRVTTTFDSNRATWTVALDRDGNEIRDFSEVDGSITHNASHLTYEFDAAAVQLPKRIARVRAWTASGGASEADRVFTERQTIFTD